MKFIKYLIFIFAIVLFNSSCKPTPNHIHNPVNSTMSGSHATQDNDTSNNYDTLRPGQPNSMDTTANKRAG